MRWHRVTPGTARRMPWKNGGGTTLELAIEPPGATLEGGFNWRLSSAEVRASGPFSRFPGIERTLLLLAGEGFDLDFGSSRQVVLDEPWVPVCFPGDRAVSATLRGGPCVDFNLMVDPVRCRARLEVLRAPGRLCLAPGGHTLMLFIASGTAVIPALDLHLGQGHLLRVDEAADVLEVVPGYGGVVLIVVSVSAP